MAIMNALSTAVTGIKSQQTALDVIANNIANVNTVGYKAQTVTFSDILSQTIKSATAATETTGSTNPAQVGLGVSVASTSTDMSVGSTSSSSNWTDVALTGAGYFIVQTSSGSYAYTRNGSMSVDSEGNLTIDGYIVCGWQAYTLDEDGNIVYNTSGDIEPINIYSDSYAGNKFTLAPVATTSSKIGGYLSSNAKVVDEATLYDIGDTEDLDFDATTEIEVFDSQGNAYNVTVSLKKCAVEGDVTSWYWELSSADGVTLSPASGYIGFDASGNIVTDETYSFNTVSNITLTTPASAGTNDITLKLDFSNLVTRSLDSSSLSDDTNGYSSGTAQSYSISSDGTIYCTYSNDATLSVGQIALAVFTNAQGLSKIGDTLYTETISSGDRTFVVAGTGGSGTMTGYALELSNVDLAAEFSDMLISQRAYQANTKVISTADDMLQSLINMVG